MDEMEELKSNCYSELVTSYNGKSVIGFIMYKVKDSADKGETNCYYTPVGSYSVSDPHIFLPIAGWYENNGYFYGEFDEDFEEYYGSYLSSSLKKGYQWNHGACGMTLYFSPAFDFWFVDCDFDTEIHRSTGCPVRPVCK